MATALASLVLAARGTRSVSDTVFRSVEYLLCQVPVPSRALRAKPVRLGTSEFNLYISIRLLGRNWEHEMKNCAQNFVFTAFLLVAIVTPCFTAQPPTADKAIEKDRASRQAAFKAGYSVATKPKWGFFGTIFNLILEQVNDTKSAYNQISDLVNNQFVDDNAVTMGPVTINGTTETPKITRAEFLKIIDRNLIGLARLRNLEWREAKKDSAANLRAYKDQVFRGKKSRNRR